MQIGGLKEGDLAEDNGRRDAKALAPNEHSYLVVLELLLLLKCQASS